MTHVKLTISFVSIQKVLNHAGSAVLKVSTIIIIMIMIMSLLVSMPEPSVITDTMQPSL